MTLGAPAVAVAGAGDIAVLPGADGCYVAATFVSPAEFDGTCQTARLQANLVDTAIAPDGKTVYAVSGEKGDNEYNRPDILRRDAASGALTTVEGPGGCVDTDIGPDACQTPAHSPPTDGRCDLRSRPKGRSKLPFADDRLLGWDCRGRLWLRISIATEARAL